METGSVLSLGQPRTSEEKVERMHEAFLLSLGKFVGPSFAYNRQLQMPHFKVDKVWHNF